MRSNICRSRYQERNCESWVLISPSYRRRISPYAQLHINLVKSWQTLTTSLPHKGKHFLTWSPAVLRLSEDGTCMALVQPPSTEVNAKVSIPAITKPTRYVCHVSRPGWAHQWPQQLPAAWWTEPVMWLHNMLQNIEKTTCVEEPQIMYCVLGTAHSLELPSRCVVVLEVDLCLQTTF